VFELLEGASVLLVASAGHFVAALVEATETNFLGRRHSKLLIASLLRGDQRTLVNSILCYFVDSLCLDLSGVCHKCKLLRIPSIGLVSLHGFLDSFRRCFFLPYRSYTSIFLGSNEQVVVGEALKHINIRLPTLWRLLLIVLLLNFFINLVDFLSSLSFLHPTSSS